MPLFDVHIAVWCDPPIDKTALGRANESGRSMGDVEDVELARCGDKELCTSRITADHVNFGVIPLLLSERANGSVCAHCPHAEARRDDEGPFVIADADQRAASRRVRTTGISAGGHR